MFKIFKLYRNMLSCEIDIFHFKLKTYCELNTLTLRLTILAKFYFNLNWSIVFLLFWNRLDEFVELGEFN